jgi:hypothetical protein
MRVNDLLPVMDRERRLLTDENSHAAAAVMGEAAERIRLMAQTMRAAGLDPDKDSSDVSTSA